jgi:hypothetical protein
LWKKMTTDVAVVPNMMKPLAADVDHDVSWIVHSVHALVPIRAAILPNVVAATVLAEIVRLAC